MPSPPITSTQGGVSTALESAPFTYTSYMAANGPIAFETSLLPCEKASRHAVKTCSTLKIFSVSMACVNSTFRGFLSGRPISRRNDWLDLIPRTKAAASPPPPRDTPLEIVRSLIWSIEAPRPLLSRKVDKTKSVTPVRMGRYRLVALAGCSASIINFLIRKYSENAHRPPATGETSHERTMFTSATLFTPQPDTIPRPTRAPTTECVDDTGRPYLVAMAIHAVHPARTEVMPRRKMPIGILPVTTTTPEEIVLVTVEPNSTAPANSIAAPIASA
mmetsp:Transcript_5759/g.17176  ORF Transcript_5759/g.17176 Transcript_5759/m.17176 type:complete len:275 (-) Transcript_5759:282-1106(-)